MHSGDVIYADRLLLARHSNLVDAKKEYKTTINKYCANYQDTAKFLSKTFKVQDVNEYDVSIKLVKVTDTGSTTMYEEDVCSYINGSFDTNENAVSKLYTKDVFGDPAHVESLFSSHKGDFLLKTYELEGKLVTRATTGSITYGPGMVVKSFKRNHSTDVATIKSERYAPGMNALIVAHFKALKVFSNQSNK